MDANPSSVILSAAKDPLQAIIGTDLSGNSYEWFFAPRQATRCPVRPAPSLNPQSTQSVN